MLCLRATQWQVNQENHTGFPGVNLDHFAAGISTLRVSAGREGHIHSKIQTKLVKEWGRGVCVFFFFLLKTLDFQS